MSREIAALWNRAVKTCHLAENIAEEEPDSAASRAYYAAFYAVSARFMMDGATFTKHSAVETALHRDLVKTGRWPIELGDAYSSLREIRMTADYGGDLSVDVEGAKDAVYSAWLIIKAVHNENPQMFPLEG